MVLFKSTALISVIQTLRYLHSTMVLFKSLSIKIFLFRSQFTFHYGPIQIVCQVVEDKDVAIYIPLWSYSNCKTSSVLYIVLSFTFHYGPIQMLNKVSNVSDIA